MKQHQLKPGSRVTLAKVDPNDTSACKGGREEADLRLVELSEEIKELQELLYAERAHKLLVVLQAMDTGGKDGTIRNVFGPLNPQGVRVVSFKKPTPEELDRDFLWRVHRHVPGKGEIVVLNRSHYEDVLVVCVHNLVPKGVWSKRYEHINSFERMLTNEGTTILKIYLHIDPDEQRRRLQARLDDPQKQWKLSPADLAERKLWPEYTKAYEQALSKTSTPWAPWYVVPANNKWYRNLVVSTAVVQTLRSLKMQCPRPSFDISALQID